VINCDLVSVAGVTITVTDTKAIAVPKQ